MVYKTPLPNRRWAADGDGDGDGDGGGEGDSMEDIQLAPDLQAVHDGEVGLDVLDEAEEEEESDGEVEYMPPKLHGTSLPSP